MNRPSRTRTPILWSALFALLVVSSPASGQTRPEERNRPPIVTLIEAGDGEPALLRWRVPEERVDRTLVVTTRTSISGATRPSIEGDEVDVTLRGSIRPPMEKIWTLSGRFSRDAEIAPTAQWRVVDGAARLYGIEGLARARAGEKIDPDDGDQPEKPIEGVDQETPTPPGTGKTKPGKPDSSSGPSRRDPREEAKRLTDDRSDSNSQAEASKAKSLEKAMRLERIADQAVGRTGGSTIYQTLSEGGMNPTSLRFRLPEPDPRAEYELQTLLEALKLTEPQLPMQPVAPGASWKASWNGLFMKVPMRTEVTWTLVKTDEMAKTTNVAQTATLRVEYQRRLLDPKDDPSRRERLLEADGRGQVEIQLDEPMVLKARLVEQPILDPGVGAPRTVTRFRVDPVATP